MIPVWMRLGMHAARRTPSTVLTAVLLIACGAAPVPPDGPRIPTPASSPSAGVESSPPATAAPHGAGGSLSDFEAHTRHAVEDLAEIFVDVHAAIDGTDPNRGSELGMLGLSLGIWASDEKRWLGEHPPASCYDPAWVSYGEAVDLIGAAADGLRGAMDDLPGATASFEFLAGRADEPIGESARQVAEADC